MARFQFPTIDTSKFDDFKFEAPKLPTQQQVVEFTKNVGYAYVGAISVVIEKLDAATKDVQARLNEAGEQANEARDKAVAEARERAEAAQKQLAELGNKIVEFAKDSADKVRAAV